MSNRNRKAKPTTMADKKLAKAKKQIAALEEQLRGANYQVLNMRQMYEAAVGEKQGLQNQLQRANLMLTAAVSQARGKSITLKEKTLENVGKYAGLDAKDEDGNLILTALTVEQVQAMQDDLDEPEEANDA